MMQEWLKTVDFDENGFVDFYDWRKLIEEHKRLDQMFQVVEQLMVYFLESDFFGAKFFDFQILHEV